MKKLIVLISVIIIAVSFKSSAQDDGFGLGVILGEPTGISWKGWTSERNALQGAVAWSLIGEDAFYAHVDYLWHSEVFHVTRGRFPLYYGPGVKVIFADDPIVAFRVPVGLDYMFENAPIDIFFEIAPGLSFIPSTDFELDGGLGVRFWF